MKKILIADDNSENRYVLVNFLMLLGRQNDFKIFEADDSIKAFDIIEQEKPDLVFMDVKMETSEAGLDATRKVRQIPELANIPIWAITAQAMEAYDSEESDKNRCIEAGCNDYISKPFDPVQLLLKVSRFFKLEIPERIRLKMGITE
jgi:CheY-like chemotaxis protein